MSAFSARNRVIGGVALSAVAISIHLMMRDTSQPHRENAATSIEQITSAFTQAHLDACMDKFDRGGSPVTGFDGMYTHRHVSASSNECLRVYGEQQVGPGQLGDDPLLQHTECVFIEGVPMTKDGQFPDGDWTTHGAVIFVKQAPDPLDPQLGETIELDYPNGSFTSHGDTNRLRFNFSVGDLYYSFDRAAIIRGATNEVGGSASGKTDEETAKKMELVRIKMGEAMGKPLHDDRIPTLPEFDAVANALHSAVQACSSKPF